MITKASTTYIRALTLGIVVMASVAAYALPKTSGTNYTINNSSTPAGGAHLASATFQTRGSAIGVTTKALATSLPVTISGFSID